MNGESVMKNIRVLAVATIAVAALSVAAFPVWAQVITGAAHAQDMCKMMAEGKVTLVTAITTAEEHCKGKALQAAVEIRDKSLTVDVYCLEGETIMLVEIDGKTGKVADANEVPEIGARPEATHAAVSKGVDDNKP